MASGVNFSIYAGDSFSHTFTAYDTYGDVVNLFGYSGDAVARYRFGSTGTALVLEFSILNTGSGLFNISASSVQTSGLAAGLIPYQVQLTSPTNEVTTQYVGYFAVTPDIIY